MIATPRLLSDYIDRGSVLTLILAGGVGQRLAPLTRAHCKPAVAFGGRYRNIDFALSNAVNSGLRRIAVVSQYESLSLHRHLESAWTALPRRLGEFVELWPAQQRRQRDSYAGTADAVRQNLDRVEALGAKRLLVLAGDHIYRMDYRRLLACHAAHGGGVTVAATAVRAHDAHRYGVLEVGPDGSIVRFDEKPVGLAARVGPEAGLFVSMGIYVFDIDWLRTHLLRQPSWIDFGREVLPGATASGDLFAFAHVDARGRPAYWRDVGTLSEYWRAHLDLLGARPVFSLHDPAWPLWTAACDLGPVCLARGEHGEPVDVADSILADGARVEGATVHQSVLGVGARVGPGARLERVVVLPGARVPAGARIRDSIIDEDGTVHAVAPGNAHETRVPTEQAKPSAVGSDLRCAPDDAA